MSYKSILTILTKVETPTAQLDAAVAMARHGNAHLEVLCLGLDRTQAGYYYAGATAFVQQETLDHAQAEAEAITAMVKQRLQAEDIRWSCDSLVTQLGALAPAVAMQARFCDIIVQARPYGIGRDQEDEAVVEAALFEGRAPVLIVPDTFNGKLGGRRIVAAWNQSDEALTALRQALPVLKAAEHVDLTVIDPPAHGPERSDPGGRLCQMLVRHGVAADVSVLAKTMPRVSDILNRHVRDTNADMVVMGAYGHSRFREAILGGATRHMLEMAEVPVLMAH
ncbi:universal stress protein [Thioclava sp. SK-1]|uniref:universal stress protein n=1 Tax=Thioclava sp. SK-1 TaxID=1889770 RepID=UPI0008257F06|nr:universal stress protein [Thioclava sp. SK-1]OCX66670.1 universal stress protein [Thioclava sp. SK-1]